MSAPNQSVLSWLIGSTDPVVDLLTEEDKNGRADADSESRDRAPADAHGDAGGAVRGADRAGYEPTIELGAVVVQDILCRETAEDGFACDEEFPSAEVLQPADTILEVDGRRSERSRTSPPRSRAPSPVTSSS